MNKIFEGLNPRQKEAVECLSGPLLILAGAGSGKTRTLTHRIANLIAHGVKPSEILAVTFTNKAANEMKTRLNSIINDDYGDMWVGTFHGLCNRILRLHWKDAALPHTPEVVREHGTKAGEHFLGGLVCKGYGKDAVG